MSPVPVAIREQAAVRNVAGRNVTGRGVTGRGVAVRTAPVPITPPIELLLGPLKEMVVDWQLPSDLERA